MQVQTITVETVVEERCGVPVIKVSGEVDIVTAPELKSAINQIVDSGKKDVLVDLSEVTYLDSSGFGVLLSGMKRLRPTGGTITLVGCSDIIERMIRITRLDSIFGLFPTLDAAVETMVEE